MREILMALRDVPTHLCRVSNGQLNQLSPEHVTSGRVGLIQFVMADLRD